MTVGQLTVADATEQLVCERCRVADGPLTRLRGLMGRRALPVGEGLLLKPAPSIHTFFMRFAIDAVFLDAGMTVVGVTPDLAPWRMAGRRGARAVLELPAGEAQRVGIVPGATLELGGDEVTGGQDERPAATSVDPVELRRIDVDGETSLWVPLKPPAEREAAASSPARSRAWTVRPAGLALGAMLAIASLVRLGLSPQGVFAAALLAVLGVLAVVDLEFRLLPNRILGPAAIGVVALQAGLFPGRLVECLVAAAAAVLLLLLLTLLQRSAMGMGDIKLAGLLGLGLGSKVLVALTVGSLASVPVALLILVRGGSLRGATLPFGPFLAFGAAVTLLV